MKLFGSDLFSLKKEPGTLWDFAQFGVMGVSSMGFTGLNSLVTSSTFDGKAKPKERKKPEPTPKKLYQMGALNEREFAIQKEVEEAVKSVEDKFPTDVFSEPTKADFDKINDFDPDLNTRLHCFGIRKGLKLLRRELAEDKLND